jgi:hypothetical protein
MAVGDSKRGIGGWLLFFLVTLGIFNPALRLFALIGLASIRPAPPLTARWPMVLVSEGLLGILGILGCLYLCWRMLHVFEWESVRRTVIGLWLLNPGVVVLDTLMTPAILQVSFANYLSLAAVSVIRSLIYAGLWSAYLLRSKRVANTYVRPGHDIAIVFE